MANLKRRHHFLPECYQRAFANSCGQVWVKAADKPPKLRNPSTVGTRRSLYIKRQNGVEDDRIEDLFSKEVETPFAALSQRIRNESDKFSNITGEELGVLVRFVACQVVRTLAHKHCIEEQAGRPIDTDTFVRIMGRKISTLMNAWSKNPPKCRFYTPLPYVGEHFITGDNPVLAIQVNDNPVWLPTDTPKLGIIDLEEILANPEHGFLLSLSPYICVSFQGQGGWDPDLPPRTVEPGYVSFFNGLVRSQSRFFTLAREKQSLG
ncbi:MAG: DUF4238 domain-containing protein [Candidatus Acidiferrum sp.]|jgi:uncharacterized protein DUF4238